MADLDGLQPLGVRRPATRGPLRDPGLAEAELGRLLEPRFGMADRPPPARHPAFAASLSRAPGRPSGRPRLESPISPKPRVSPGKEVSVGPDTSAAATAIS